MSKEVAIKKDTSLESENWYQALVEECKAIYVERSYNAGIEIIQRNWEIGERIFSENEKMDRQKIYGKRIVDGVANEIGKSGAYIHQCLQFYKQFPLPEFKEVERKLPEGKNTSWSKITKTVLGEAGKSKEKGARRTLKIEEILQVFKAYVIDELHMDDDAIIDETVAKFREKLIKAGEK